MVLVKRFVSTAMAVILSLQATRGFADPVSAPQVTAAVLSLMRAATGALTADEKARLTACLSTDGCLAKELQTPPGALGSAISRIRESVSAMAPEEAQEFRNCVSNKDCMSKLSGLPANAASETTRRLRDLENAVKARSGRDLSDCLFNGGCTSKDLANVKVLPPGENPSVPADGQNQVQVGWWGDSAGVDPMVVLAVIALIALLVIAANPNNQLQCPEGQHRYTPTWEEYVHGHYNSHGHWVPGYYRTVSGPTTCVPN